MAITRGPGRPSLFRGKDRTRPVSAYMTPAGKQKLHAARVRLAKIVKWDADDITDGDVCEFLARGEADSRAYFKAAGVIP